MEVSPLSREVMLLSGTTSQLQPLSAPLQSSFRFVHRPLPATPSTCLTAPFPLREFPYESYLLLGELQAYHVALTYQ